MLFPFIIIIAQAILCKGSLLDYPGVNFTCNLQNLPCLDQDEWWGPHHLKEHQDTSIRPFKIQFAEEMVYDLRYRLHYHRSFIPPLEGVGFQYGFNTRVLQDLVRYWAEEYPFEEREKFLNKYPMYKTNIQGLDVHFLWVKPKTSKKPIVPLLLLHGWPGSIREFYEAIPLLTAVEEGRDFALELVIPSLPGFGWSDSAVRPGLGSAQTGVIMRNLMHRLGFKQLYVQGGDLGGVTGLNLATMYPKEVLGYHTNWPFTLHPTTRLMQVFAAVYPPLVVDPALTYRMYPLYEKFTGILREIGYLHEQATKPDTIGVPLSDSPAGLMAYHLEKFSFSLGRRGSDDLNTVPRDSLLDHLMFYWAPNSITTAMRFYAETFNRRHFGLGLDVIPCQVPTWTIQAENEVTYDSPPLLRVKIPYLVNDTAIPYGSHFLAFETPKVFADDVLRAIGAFRRIKQDETHLTLPSLEQDNWRISLPDLLLVLSTLWKHPEAWWIKNALIFICDALSRVAKQVFKLNGFSNLIGLN